MLLITQWTREQHWASLGYNGPAPGRYCDINPLCVELEAGGSIYAYMEQCCLVEKRPDGKWIGVIEMGMVWGHTWAKDGTRVILDENDISEARDKPCYSYPAISEE